MKLLSRLKDGFVWGELLPAPLPPGLIERHREEDGDVFFVFVFVFVFD